MAGTIEELLDIKREAIESLNNLSDEELILLNEFLIDLLYHTNKELKIRISN